MSGEPVDPVLDAGALVGLLADDVRRQVVAALVLGASSFETVVSATGLDAGQVASAVGRLCGAGLVIAEGEQLILLEAAFSLAARAALSRPRRTEHADRPADDRKIFDAFVVDGRITQAPVSPAKREVLLDWLAQSFDIGRRYSEVEVNRILDPHRPDVSTWRRYLVDGGFLDRAAGVYWRSGGSVTVADP